MVAPKLLACKIFHKRHFPKVNQFTYNSFYMLIPIGSLSKIRNKLMRIGRFGLFSFHTADHLITDHGTDLEQNIYNLLSNYDINIKNGYVILMAMPRVLGYVFNPVSFWFCYDSQNQLIAVLAEVRNTYGEKHCYLCYKKDHTPIYKSDTLIAQKVFHVSPFIKRQGIYKFCFDSKDEKININIDLHDENNKKLLSTSVSGNFIEYTNKNLLYYFICYPFVTAKTIILIHWQALKLFLKGIKFLNKPNQLESKITKTTDHNEDY